MTKQEVIEYVMTTPGNPNRAVLSGMLDGLDEGGSSRVLLYENEAVDISQKGSDSIAWASLSSFFIEPTWYGDNDLISIEIDDTTIISETPTLSSNASAFIGLRDPSDTSGITAGKNAGASFVSGTVSGKRMATMVNLIMINSNIIPMGTHSIKIYKEV